MDRRGLPGGRPHAATSWHPDGDRFLYAYNYGTAETVGRIPPVDLDEEVTEIDVETETRRRLIEHPADEFEAAWAPDGERILFESNRTDDAPYGLFIENLTTGERRRIELPFERFGDARWCPLGRRIALTAAPPGEFPTEIYVLRIWRPPGGNP